jgi:hypothetical protein
VFNFIPTRDLGVFPDSVIYRIFEIIVQEVKILKHRLRATFTMKDAKHKLQQFLVFTIVVNCFVEQNAGGARTGAPQEQQVCHP